MKKVHLGLMVIGMMTIGQFNAQTTKDHPRHDKVDFFTKMDANKDGAITIEEMKTRDGDEAKKADRFKKMDTNSDGKITKAEMEKMRADRAEKQKNKLTPDERFAKADKNADGSLTLDEMGGKDEAGKADRFKKLDKNADGRVTQEELMAHKAEHKGKKGEKKTCAKDCQKAK
jgi:Ca2+-binding EF-hand superfamily protein